MFLSSCFQISFLSLNFHEFKYILSWCEFLGFTFVDDPLTFLNLYICVFSPYLEVFNHYLFKYLFSLTFSFHTVALMILILALLLLSHRSWYCFLISLCFWIGKILLICQSYWFYLILASLSYLTCPASFLFLISVIVFQFCKFHLFF